MANDNNYNFNGKNYKLKIIVTFLLLTRKNVAKDVLVQIGKLYFLNDHQTNDIIKIA